MLVCGGCRRHVRERDASCPFCATPLRTVSAPLAAAVVSMMLACGPSLGGSSGEDGGAVATTSGATDDVGADVSTGTPSTTGDVPDSSSSSMGESTDEGDDVDSDSGAGFIYGAPDGTFECDLFAQDCMPGEKCAPYDTSAPGFVDSTACVPIPSDPDPLGAPCEYDPSTGDDSCQAGALCLSTGPDGQGRCEAVCTGNAAEPVCEAAGTTCATVFDFVPVCLAACDPVQPAACPDGEACTPVFDDWVCIGSLGVPSGTTCEFANACEPGTVCAASDAVDGCEGGCCMAVCDLDAPDPDAQCEAPAQCVPYYGDEPPDGLAHVGVCGAAG